MNALAAPCPSMADDPSEAEEGAPAVAPLGPCVAVLGLHGMLAAGGNQQMLRMQAAWAALVPPAVDTDAAA